MPFRTSELTDYCSCVSFFGRRAKNDTQKKKSTMLPQAKTTFCVNRKLSHPILKPTDQRIWQLGLAHLALSLGDIILDPLEQHRACIGIEDGVGGARILIAWLTNTAGVQKIPKARLQLQQQVGIR